MQPIGAHACQPGVYRSRDPIPVRTLHFFLQTLTSLHQADFVRGGGVGSGGDGGQPLTEVADHFYPIFDLCLIFYRVCRENQQEDDIDLNRETHRQRKHD